MSRFCDALHSSVNDAVNDSQVRVNLFTQECGCSVCPSQELQHHHHLSQKTTHVTFLQRPPHSKAF